MARQIEEHFIEARLAHGDTGQAHPLVAQQLHRPYEQLTAGRMTAPEATDAVTTCVMRLLGAGRTAKSC